MEEESSSSALSSVVGIATIPCCECGVSIEPNNFNMCANCKANHLNIAVIIPKQSMLQRCRSCERYLQPRGEWVSAARESRQLLTLCLKKLKDLRAEKLVDSQFVYTEPHSKRLKVKLTIRGQVPHDIKLQQEYIVEYVIQNRMCNDCHRIEAKDYWRCLVQLRQHTDNKKALYYVEQLILRNKAHANTLGIKSQHGGLDFYYANENHARKMVEFLQASVPVKVTQSKRLMSHDIKSNIFNYKTTWSVELAAVSKDTVVCLSKKLRQQLGNLAPLCLIEKVTSAVHLIDPLTGRRVEMSGKSYFRAPFTALCNPKQLVEYMVMDIEDVPVKARKTLRSDIWLVRVSDLGINDRLIHTRTHLGQQLKVGDAVLGYNLAEANINDAEYELLGAAQIPDVLLVRKSYADQKTRSSQRHWKLKHLAVEAPETRDTYAYHDFLEDLEEDPSYRQHVNIYRDAEKTDTSAHHIDNLPQVALAELLDDLCIATENTKS